MPPDAAFTYDGGRVDPGTRQNLRYAISETYLGDPVRIPVTIVNGERPGPTLFLSAASHGDELNGIEVVREVAHDWDLSDLRGTLVCLPVLNVPGFLARIFGNFIAPCDLGIDLHTSTRGRTNMLHVRADMSDDAVARLARAFGSHVIIDSEGGDGLLRTEATRAEIPTVTVEMGEAHRFQRDLIDDALAGVRSVFAEYDLLEPPAVRWPGWRTVIRDDDERT